MAEMDPSSEPAGSSPAVRVVIADDHALIRTGVRAMLEQIPEVEVVHEAGTGTELQAACIRLQPDLVITDYTMPDIEGTALLEALRRVVPGARLIVVSMHDAPEIVRRAVQAGANGYVLKGAPPIELEQAVRAAMAGSAYFSPEVTQRLLMPAEPRPEDILTPRQLDILRRLALGRSSKEVAFDLGLSPKTVDAHRARIMERLMIREVPGLTLYCVRNRLIDPQSRR